MDVEDLASRVAAAVGKNLEGQIELTRRAETLVRQELDEERARREDEPLSFGESWRTVWAVRTVRRLFIADLWMQGAVVIFTAFLGFFLAETYGLTAFQRSLVLLPATLALVAGAFVGGGLVDTMTRRSPGRVLVLFGSFAAISAVGLTVLALGLPGGDRRPGAVQQRHLRTRVHAGRVDLLHAAVRTERGLGARDAGALCRHEHEHEHAST